MKRTFLTLLILATALTALAQATQPCIVKQYNQKQQKTPLGGVQVEVRDAQSATSAANGAVTLQFATLKPGDRITVRRIIKPGYEIFNKAAIDQWTITRGATSEIVLVQSAYFAQLKSNLTQSSTDNYKKKYEQEKAEKERLLKAGKLKEEEYRRQLNDLEDQYDNALKNLDNYIDQFARIDLSEVSEEEQHILDMVEEGKIDEAVKAYEALDISGKLRQARENVRAIDEGIEKLEDKRNQELQAIADLKERQKREIATLKLAGGKENYDKVAQILKENALADTTNIDAVWEYAKFADLQKNYIDALHYYSICQNICTPSQLCDFQFSIGAIYYMRGLYDEAKEFFLLSLENAISTNNQDVESNANEALGTTYYSHSFHFDIIEEYWQKAFEIRYKLYKEDTSNSDYLYHLALIERKLGMLYASKWDYDKAEYFYQSAYDHYELLSHQDNDNYLEELAKFQVRYGDYYVSRNYLSLAEKQFLSALSIYTQLYNNNPELFRSQLAGIYKSVGKFYCQEFQDYDKAKFFFVESLQIDSVLYSYNPDMCCFNYATSLSNLGIILVHEKDWPKAEKNLLAALDLFIMKYNQDTESITSYNNLINHLSLLVTFYKEYPNGYDKCERYLKEIIKIDKNRYDANISDKSLQQRLKNSMSKLGEFYLDNDKIEQGRYLYEQIHQIDPEESINWNIGEYYSKQANKAFDIKDFLSAERKFLDALSYFNNYLSERTNETYSYRIEIISDVLYRLGLTYYNLKEYAKTENYYIKALEKYTLLLTQGPNKDAYLKRKASIQNRLANLYYKNEDYKKAEKFYLKFMENFNVLFNQYPDAYRTDMATTQYNLGNLYYFHLHDYAKAEEYYLKALENRTLLFAQNPDKYREDLADIQHNLGNLYYNLHDYAKAEEYLLKALENRSQLFVQDSSSGNCNDLAWTQYRLGNLYCFHLNDYAKAEDFYLKALENRTQLFSQNPDTYRADLAMTQQSLGSLYNFRLNNYVKAEEYILKALENHTQLFSKNPDTYRDALASSYNQLAYLYAHQNNFAKALETIDRAIELLHEEASLYDSKGEILLMKGDEQEAVKMWKKILELDPDFLQKYEGGTDFYKQLKEKGLLDN